MCRSFVDLIDAALRQYPMELGLHFRPDLPPDSNIITDKPMTYGRVALPELAFNSRSTAVLTTITVVYFPYRSTSYKISARLTLRARTHSSRTAVPRTGRPQKGKHESISPGHSVPTEFLCAALLHPISTPRFRVQLPTGACCGGGGEPGCAIYAGAE